MSEELAHTSTSNLEDQVIFDQGCLPLAFDDPTSNYKTAVSVILDRSPHRAYHGRIAR